MIKGGMEGKPDIAPWAAVGRRGPHGSHGDGTVGKDSRQRALKAKVDGCTFVLQRIVCIRVSSQYYNGARAVRTI